MSIARAERAARRIPAAQRERRLDLRRPPLGSALALVLAGALVLTACSDSDSEPSGRPLAGAAAPSDGVGDRGLPVPPDLVKAFTRTLERRSEAVLDTDRAAFARSIDLSDVPFRDSQGVYFDNMAQLPLDTYELSVNRRSMVREGDEYWVVVEVRTQLQGYDEAPVLSRDRYRFVPTRRAGRFVISSVSDPAWEEANQVQVQPWDAGPIRVREGIGVLGIFDPSSEFAGRRLVRSVEQGIADVDGTVPYDWSRSVVLYALSDTRFISGLEVPGDDPEHPDGLAFSVPAAPGEGDPGDFASTRFVLNPRMLSATPLETDRLVRHELTHVAIGDRDDLAPVWLSEGIAEYVSVRPLAPEDRQITSEAIAAAQAGVDRLPGDDEFNGPGSAANYGLAWWACEYLVSTFGAQSLWTLLDELDRPDLDADERFKELTAMSTRMLARRGADLMVATYAPEPRRNRSRTEAPQPDEVPEPDQVPSP